VRAISDSDAGSDSGPGFGVCSCVILIIWQKKVITQAFEISQQGYLRSQHSFCWRNFTFLVDKPVNNSTLPRTALFSSDKAIFE
jgi:hypothetical protein